MAQKDAFDIVVILIYRLCDCLLLNNDYCCDNKCYFSKKVLSATLDHSTLPYLLGHSNLSRCLASPTSCLHRWWFVARLRDVPICYKSLNLVPKCRLGLPNRRVPLGYLIIIFLSRQSSSLLSTCLAQVSLLLFIRAVMSRPLYSSRSSLFFLLAIFLRHS